MNKYNGVHISLYFHKGKKMGNPIIVEVMRGNIVESVHHGAFCVVDETGHIVKQYGDVQKEIFPRSAVKSMQALLFVESGAAGAFQMNEAEIALACSSHNSEALHVSTAQTMLQKAGLNEDMLECGGYWQADGDMLVREISSPAEKASHNACSGKHAAFLCNCQHLGYEKKGYIHSSHPLQKQIADILTNVTLAHHGEETMAIDGCSLPTYAISLKAMAHGFARMISGVGLETERAKAAHYIMQCCMNTPFHVAGTKRFDSDIMTLGKGKIFAKIGAEGISCAALPTLGLGIAIKCEDGSIRGAKAMMAALIAALLPQDDALQEGLKTFSQPLLKNANGLTVGQIKPVMV